MIACYTFWLATGTIVIDIEKSILENLSMIFYDRYYGHYEKIKLKIGIPSFQEL